MILLLINSIRKEVNYRQLKHSLRAKEFLLQENGCERYSFFPLLEISDNRIHFDLTQMEFIPTDELVFYAIQEMMSTSYLHPRCYNSFIPGKSLITTIPFESGIILI